MRKLLEVVRHPNEFIEFRVNGRHVLFLGKVSFDEVRSAAYNYVWDRPQFMWSIKGVVA